MIMVIRVCLSAYIWNGCGVLCVCVCGVVWYVCVEDLGEIRDVIKASDPVFPQVQVAQRSDPLQVVCDGGGGGGRVVGGGL